MALVCLHGPLKKLAGDRAEHRIEGATVDELLRGLEQQHVALSGWILDERGTLRRHINVYVNGERSAQGASTTDADRIEVLPAISGG